MPRNAPPAGTRNKKGSRGEAPCGVQGRGGPLPVGDTRAAARNRPARLSRILRIRETARTATKEQTVPAPSILAGGYGLFCLLFFPLKLGIRESSSFSLPRKKQRGPAGAAEFSLGTSPPPDSPFAPISSWPILVFAPIASRGRAVTCASFCELVRRSPVRRRGAAGTMRASLRDAGEVTKARPLGESIGNEE